MSDPFIQPPGEIAAIAVNTVGHTLIPIGVVATWIGYLPSLGALVVAVLGAIFYSIEIYESTTFRHWRVNHIMKKKARKLARLRAKEKMVLAKIAALETVNIARREARKIMNEGAADAAKITAHEPVETASKQTPVV